jgi:hypothetical protein
MNNSSGFPDQCGITVISNLSSISAEDQFLLLKQTLLNTNGTPRQAMVLLSDVENEDRWVEAKKFSTRTKVMTNPNSHNEIRLYMFRPEDLKDFEKSLKKNK